MSKGREKLYGNMSESEVKGLNALFFIFSKLFEPGGFSKSPTPPPAHHNLYDRSQKRGERRERLLPWVLTQNRTSSNNDTKRGGGVGGKGGLSWRRRSLRNQRRAWW